MKNNILNFLLFQVGWFACVVGAAKELYWLGPAAAVLLLAAHFAFIVPKADAAGELRLMAAATLIFPAIDAALSWLGVFEFKGGLAFGVWPPLWIVALWSLLAGTIRHSMAYMKNNKALQWGFSIVGSPLSYAAGARLGALTIAPPFWKSALIIAAVWSAAVPMLFLLDSKLKRGDPA